MTDVLADATGGMEAPHRDIDISDLSSDAWFRTAKVARLSTVGRVPRWRIEDRNTNEISVVSTVLGDGVKGVALHAAIVVEAAIRPTDTLCALRMDMTPTDGGAVVMADAIASPWKGLVTATGDVRGYTSCVSKVPGGWLLEVLCEAFETEPMTLGLHFWPCVGVEGAVFEPRCVGEIIVRAPLLTRMTLEQATQRRYAMYEAVGTTQ